MFTLAEVNFLVEPICMRFLKMDLSTPKFAKVDLLPLHFVSLFNTSLYDIFTILFIYLFLIVSSNAPRRMSSYYSRLFLGFNNL